MGKTELISPLSVQADAVRRMGATALFLYGSRAGETPSPGSDLDLFIDYDPDSRFNAFDLIGIKHHLEEKLQHAVDLTTRDGLHPRLRARIEQGAIRIF